MNFKFTSKNKQKELQNINEKLLTKRAKWVAPNNLVKPEAISTFPYSQPFLSTYRCWARSLHLISSSILSVGF